MNNAEYADSLRKMATFFESRPEIENPGLIQFNIFLSADALKLTARQIGAFEKRVDDNYFNLVKKFGEVTVEWFSYRSQVCEKVRIGSKVIPETIIPAKPEEIIPAHEVEEFEWKCPESLLAEADNANSH